jgi:hypothetical protein
MKNNKLKIILPIFFIAIFVMSSLTTANLKGTTVPISDNVITTSQTYDSDLYVEGIDLYPLRGQAIGINTAMVGGEVELPFDLTTYSNLAVFNLIAANQRAWQLYSMRRFWDVPDGVAMMLVFRQQSASNSIAHANEIKDMVQTAYGIRLHLVYGQYQSVGEVTQLIYLGDFVGTNDLSDFIGNFTSYTSSDGFGAGITYDLLNDAPVKSMSIGVIHGRFPFIGSPTSDWIPVLECSWIDPDGLSRSGSIVDMNLTTIMPNLGSIQGASYSNASFVTMELPYIVDVLEIDPPTDNMYPHLRRRFEWVVKMDIALLNISIDHIYSDIHVKYDFNLTNLLSYPEVIGEMTIASDLPIMEGDDLIYNFTFENVGKEPAYNIEVVYGEFGRNDTLGVQLPYAKSDLTFDKDKNMYYNNITGLLSETFALGPEIITIHGWFYNTTLGDWVGNNQYFSGGDELYNLVVENETYLNLNPMDFTPFDLDEDTVGLNATIPVLNPGENITLSFAIENFPSDTDIIYAPIPIGDSNIYILNMTIIDYLQILGSTLHIPEDQQTWTHLFLEPVIGTSFVYEDVGGIEYMGVTNGLVIQLYDDEAILVGKVTLDKDVYRFGENATFTLEITNVGDANATNVNYAFGHAFVTDQFDLSYVELIPGSEGTIPLIQTGETVVVQHEQRVITNIGLHPVFAILNYTSDETADPDYDIFSTVGHAAVASSMDFGIVIPPLDKEGRLEPTYPTPEVEVVTELLYDGNLTQGDEIVLRCNVTNVGDEPTNIIFRQRIPDTLTPLEETLSVTVEGVPYTGFDVAWAPRTMFSMGVGIVADTIRSPRDADGIPLGVNETIVVEITLRVNTRQAADVFIPPTEIRYRSEFDMVETNGINEDVGVPEEAADISQAIMSGLSSNLVDKTINTDATSIPTDTATTNSWGAYANSLSLVIEGIANLNISFIYIGVGLIAVTGVAVLIYFRANGKKH